MISICSAFLYEMGKLYCIHDYVMQLHIGTYLVANRKYVKRIGQSTGFVDADDSTRVQSVGELLNRLHWRIDFQAQFYIV